MTPHCATCICDQPGSLEAINRRCHRLAAKVVESLLLSVDLFDRLSPFSGKFRFGFTGFKLTVESNIVGGQFLCALFPSGWRDLDDEKQRMPTRFYYVDALSLYTDELPMVAPYRPGDLFLRTRVPPTLEELEHVVTWPDERLEGWVRKHIAVLHERIEADIVLGV